MASNATHLSPAALRMAYDSLAGQATWTHASKEWAVDVANALARLPGAVYQDRARDLDQRVYAWEVQGRGRA